MQAPQASELMRSTRICFLFLSKEVTIMAAIDACGAGFRRNSSTPMFIELREGGRIGGY